MKRILSTAAFIILIVAIAAVAVYALNGASVAQTAAAPAAVPGSASVETNALAPAAGEKYNAIALPLDSSASFTYMASGLKAYVGASASAVMKWDATNQQYVTYTGGPGDFALETGGAYFLLLDSTADNVLSFVGDVPPEGSISFSLVKDTGTGCKYNAISLPLDQDQITLASELMTDIGGVTSVTRWDAAEQKFVSYTGGLGDFAVSIGYPYFVCLNNGAPANWP